MVEVYIYSSGLVSKVYPEEAKLLIENCRACLPGEQFKTEIKAEKADYQNKMIEAPVRNKHGKKAK